MGFIGGLEIFQNAIQAVLQDEGFKVPSHEASHALETARNLIKWISDSINETTTILPFTRMLTIF